MTLEEQVNEAITNHLSALYNLDVLNNKYNHDVLQTIGNIAYYATNEVLQTSDDNHVNHQETMTALAIKYPFLTEASRIKIADISAYFWK
jgi:hypothetical protein